MHMRVLDGYAYFVFLSYDSTITNSEGDSVRLAWPCEVDCDAFD
jgi:hypothetical protein